MISRRILAAVALLCALVIPAHAQKTKTQLNTEVGTALPDNNVGAITPLGLRSLSNDIINSIMPAAPVVSGNLVCFTGTTGLLQDCGIGPSASSPVNYYVATTGNDSNSCLTALLPCLTPQGAWNKIAVTNHGSGGSILNIADGLYTSSLLINGTWSGAGPLSIVGDCATPGNVIVNPASGVSAVTVLNARVSLSCFGLITSGGGAQLFAGAGAEVSISNMKFADALGGGDQLFVTDGGLIMLSGDYTVGGTFGSHMHFRRGGRIMLPTNGHLTATLLGTPAATNYFVGGNAAFVDLNGITWAGATATGPKFFLHNGARLNTGTGGNLAWLPAASAGVFDSWAQYDNTMSGVFGLSAGAPLAPDALYTANSNTGATAALPFVSQFHGVGANGGSAGYTFDTFASQNNSVYRRADGTLASKSAVGGLGQINSFWNYAWDGSAYGFVGGLDFFTLNTQTGSDHSGCMRGLLVPSGATLFAEVWRACSGFMIGTTSDPGAGKLSVAGAILDNAAWSTYSPAVVSSTPGGTPATYTVNSARYKCIGKTCFVKVDVSVTNQGVGAAGSINIDLPFAAASNAGTVGPSTEYGATGKSGRAFVANSATQMKCIDSTNTTYIATGNAILASATYEIP